MTREEAIKVAYGIPVTKAQHEALETLIPELKESDDERIRKEIVNYFSQFKENGLRGVDINIWIAYLEKQKAKERLDRMAPIYNDKESFESALEKAWKYYNESASRKVDSFEDDYIECVFSKGFREGFLYKEKQKDASKAIEAVERIDKYIDEHVVNAHDMKNSHPDKKYYSGWDDALGKMAGILQDVYSDEKQKEQKPAEKPSMLEQLREHLTNTPKEQLDAEFEALKEFTIPKSTEWSEEDEEMIQDIIDLLDPNIAASDFHEIENWFKSLPERFNLQSMPEKEIVEEKEFNEIYHQWFNEVYMKEFPDLIDTAKYFYNLRKNKDANY